jgi:uncharacterized membrane protein
MIIKFAIKIIHPCVHRHEFADQKAASAPIINWLVLLLQIDAKHEKFINSSSSNN